MIFSLSRLKQRLCTEAASAASSEFYQLPVQHIPGVFKTIGTGGQCDNPVVSRDLQVCLEVRSAAHFLQSVRVFPDAAEGLHISGRVHGGDITGKEFDPALFHQTGARLRRSVPDGHGGHIQKIYEIPREYQHIQAEKAGLDYGGGIEIPACLSADSPSVCKEPEEEGSN